METAVTLFMALETQWNRSMHGLPLSLNYNSIEPTARLLGLKMTPEVFIDIRNLEVGAASYFAARAAAK
jgi:Phage related hypothetical protein (DUF1799)